MKLTHNQVTSEVEETLEECYGREGELSQLLERAAKQRRLEKTYKPEID